MRSKTRRQSDQNSELAGQALEAYRSGASFREVAHRINRSVSVAHKLVKRELQEIAAQRAELAGLVFDEVVERERLIIAEAFDIAMVACPTCSGAKALGCRSCGGSGRRASARERLAALDRIRRSDELLVRLHGLEAPTRARLSIVHTDPIKRHVDSLTDEEVAAELEALFGCDCAHGHLGDRSGFGTHGDGEPLNEFAARFG
jgi:hypothetical protein